VVKLCLQNTKGWGIWKLSLRVKELEELMYYIIALNKVKLFVFQCNIESEVSKFQVCVSCFNVSS
jgi:hypothetical protein